MRKDFAAAAAAVTFAAADTVLGLPSDRPAVRWALVLAGAVVVGLVRRFPLPVLGAEVVLFGLIGALAPEGTGAPAVFVIVALTTVAYRQGWRVTAASLVATYAMVLVVIGRSGIALLTGAGGMLRAVVVALAVAAPAMLGRHLRAVRRTARLAEQRAHDAELRRLAEDQTARLQERTRIAGDLHDIVAHHVSAIALQAGSGHYAATHAASDEQRLAEAVAALGSIRDNAGQTLEELRDLLRVLRDPATIAAADRPAVEPEAMIEDAVQRSRDAGIEVSARVDDRVRRTPLAARITAARAVQEALTNALKHAGPGTDVTATVAVEDHTLRVEVVDTGPAGRRPAMPESGHGLAGLRERVDVLGGTLTAEPVRPAGWRLAVSLPLRVAS